MEETEHRLFNLVPEVLPWLAEVEDLPGPEWEEGEMKDRPGEVVGGDEGDPPLRRAVDEVERQTPLQHPESHGEIGVPLPVDRGRAEDRQGQMFGVGEGPEFAGPLAPAVEGDRVGEGLFVEGSTGLGGARRGEGADQDETLQVSQR